MRIAEFDIIGQLKPTLLEKEVLRSRLETKEDFLTQMLKTLHDLNQGWATFLENGQDL